MGGLFVASVRVVPHSGEKAVVIRSKQCARKVDAEKDAALRACEYLMKYYSEYFRALRLPQQVYAAADPEPHDEQAGAGVEEKYGLNAANATGYLMHCAQIRSIARVERPDPVPAGSGFVAQTVVVLTNGTQQEFKCSAPRPRKRQAQLEADLRAAIWVYENLKVHAPPAMARVGY